METIPLKETRCAICGSADTCFCSYNTLASDLYCRSCGRTVWEDELHGDASTVERLYLADGSIRETVIEPPEPDEDEEIEERIRFAEQVRRYELGEHADAWQEGRVKVRILPAPAQSIRRSPRHKPKSH